MSRFKPRIQSPRPRYIIAGYIYSYLSSIAPCSRRTSRAWSLASSETLGSAAKTRISTLTSMESDGRKGKTDC